MKLLLDTHSFLWFIEGSDRLSGYGRRLIEDRGNQRFLSVGSFWEIAQALTEGMNVVGRDQKFDLYPVQRVWSETDADLES